MTQEKYLFIDRDGTLIKEPDDQQVDSLEKLDFIPGVFSALSRLSKAGYQLIMISNQDGRGTTCFPEGDFIVPHEWMLKIFRSQDISFADILICPHTPEDGCDCRKPNLGLLMDYLVAQRINKKNSYVIGDRESDMALAERLGCEGIRFTGKNEGSWPGIAQRILDKPRTATSRRQTKETDISIAVNLDTSGLIQINTGQRFFDHMLEQVAKHAGMSATVQVLGDWDVDDHHTIEDTAIALGGAIKEALGDKRGIARFGFLLPMDESSAEIALDLSGRRHCQFNATFKRETVGGVATEMWQHFFSSFADGLSATLHMDVRGDNTHHMVEVAFKGLGRVLKQAIVKDNDRIPSTKGVL